MRMRPLSEISAPIIRSTARSFDRRPVRSVQSSFTCLVLVKHAESDGQILVSDDGDAVGAVWLSKAPLLIDPKDRGPFLVVTITHQLAQQKRLFVSLFDWDRYTPSERALLKDAVDTARRTRSRLSGYEEPLPFPGREYVRMRPENTPELIERARQFLLEKPSVSYIQRKLVIGYNQAMELMEHFEQIGIVSKPNSAGVRTVLDRSPRRADKEINRATINAFLARAINRAAASAIDAEFGLRVRTAEVTEQGYVRCNLDNGHVLVIDFDHLVPRDPMDPQRFFDAMKGKSTNARS